MVALVEEQYVDVIFQTRSRNKAVSHTRIEKKTLSVIMDYKGQTSSSTERNSDSCLGACLRFPIVSSMMVLVITSHLPWLFHGRAPGLATEDSLLRDLALPANLQEMASYAQLRRHLKVH